MLKISFVQPNFRQGPGGVAAYLPYSCGLLWAYALTSDLVKENFERQKFVYQRDPIEETAQELAQCNIVAFSTYVWNRNYNYTLAARIKEINPDVFVVFGGPEPPVSKKNIFKDIMPFADAIVKREGEITFRNLLEHYIRKEPYDNIAGLLLNRDGEVLETGDGERIQLLDQIPSPYTSGVFDHLLPLEAEWNGTYETNRGCPYQCTFCDWGSLTYSKIKKFDLERVFGELEWFGKNKISFLDNADANFGIFPDRDNLIIDKLLDVQKRYGFPYRTNWAWAKNQKSEIIKMARKVMHGGTGFNNGLTISLQSLDEHTLDTIKRSNLEVNKIAELFEECQKNNVPLNNELILGLPGENKDSWRRTLFKLIEIGQHDGFEAWQCQLLENAEMNLLQRRLHGINGIKVSDYFSNGWTAYEASETIEIVTSTNTMPQPDMVASYAQFWFLLTWHMGGLSQFVSRFVHKYLGVDYVDFYDGFRKYLNDTDEVWREEEETFAKCIDSWYTTGDRIEGWVGEIQISAINFHFKSLFRMHLDGLQSRYHQLVEEYTRLQYSDKIPAEILDEVIRFNNSYITRYGEFDDGIYELDYNLHEYLVYKDAELVKKPTKIRTWFPHDLERSKDFLWYVQAVYFARRRNFGKNFLETIE